MPPRTTARSTSDPLLVHRFEIVSRVAAASAALIGITAFAGWTFGIATLQSLLPGQVTIKINAALAFVLLGISVWSSVSESRGSFRRRVSQACASLATLIGLLTLAEYLFQLSLGIDQLLFAEKPGAIGTFSPGRMPPFAALNFVLLGTALLLLDVGRSRRFRAAELLVFPAAATAIEAFLEYFFRIPSFYGVAAITRIAPAGSVAFVLLCVGVLCARPDRGLMAVASTRTQGGTMWRRLLPAAIGVSLLLGWLKLRGEKAGYFGTEMGTILLLWFLMVVLALLIWSYAQSLDTAERERRRNECRFEAVLDGLPAMVCLLTQNYEIAFANCAFRKQFGEAKGRKCYDWCFGRSQPCDFCEAFKVLETSAAHDWEVTTPDGRRIHAFDSPFTDADGSPLILEMDLDVTEQRRAEEALRAASQYSRNLIEASLDPLVTISSDGKITDVNQATELATGASRQELIGSDFSDYFTEPEKARQGYRQVFELGAVRDYPLAIRHTSGRITDVLYNASVYKNGAGQVQGVFAAARDITENKRETEGAARLREAELEEAQRIAHTGSWQLVSETGEITWTKEIYRVFGIDPGLPAPAYQQLKDILAPDSFKRMDAAIENTRRTGAPYHIDLELSRSDGSTGWISARGEAVRDATGKVTSLRGTAQDITERKQVEEKLREEAALLDLAHDAILVRDSDDRIRLWSRGAIDTYGFSAEAAVGKISHELLKTVFPIPLKDIQAYIAQTREWEGELRHTRQDSHEIVVASRWSLLRDEQGNTTGVMEINRDITERKQAEEALRKIEWMLTEKETRDSEQAGTPQSSTTPLPAYGDLTELNSCRLILDSVGKPVLQEITSDFLALLGTSAAIFEKNGDYAFGALSSIWCRTLDSASRGLCHTSDNSEALRSGQWICRESCWNRSAGLTMQTGQPTDMECDGGLRIHSVPIHAGAELIGSMSFGYGDPPREESKLLELAAKYGVPIEELRRQAESYESRPAFIIEMAKKRLRTAANRIGEIVLRKRMEIELEQKAKDLAKSNDELGQFAYVASHDLQEPLRKIGAFGDRLAEHCEAALDEQGRDYLQRMQNAAQRMSLLIESLLALSRVTSKARALEVVDLNSVVSDVLSDLEVRIQQTGGRVEVEALPTVMADGSQMRQLFQNLIGNALKFHKQDVPPLVRVQTKENGKGTWEIHVVDNGIGFDEQYVARIFRPFQRLHARSAFEGSGIGLAICNKIVGRHLGQITARSQPGVGSDFVVVLPRTPIAKEAKA